MINKLFLSISLLGILSIVSCTGTRWTVQDHGNADPNDYEVIDREQLLRPAGTVSPEDPVLRMELYSRTEYEFAQKVLAQRNIQEYRPRPGYLALGAMGASLAFYAGNSMALSENLSSTQSFTLNAAGGLLALSGLLAMKPVGEPRPTGEEQYLRQTGTSIQVDTTRNEGPAEDTATIEISYQDSSIYYETDREMVGGRLEVSLGRELNALQITGEQPGVISAEVTFNDSTYGYQYPVDAILQPYAQVQSQLTALRNSPESAQDNILAELLQGSEVHIQQSGNNQWYQVVYGGISDNYILKDDAEVVWRPSDFSQDEQVVTVPQIPFGDVDVESNIPVLRGQAENAVALILTNENYAGEELSQRNYAHRDGRLIKTYLQTALGYQDNNIHELSDITSSTQIHRKLMELRSASNDSTELFIYVSAYGAVERGADGVDLSLLNIKDDQDTGGNSAIDLRAFLKELSTIPSAQTMVVGDTDFSRSFREINLTSDEEQQVLESYASELENSDKRTAFLWGMQLSQPSGIYVSGRGEDKKHRIFPYYFAEALQNRRTAVSSIYQYLQQNVSYTSRRLHDRSQDPILMGDVFWDFVNK